MKEFSEGYTNADILLPIVRDINTEGKFLSFMNESVWAYGFSTDQGVIDKDLLMEYQNFQTSGGLYRTQVVKGIDRYSFLDIGAVLVGSIFYRYCLAIHIGVEGELIN